MNHSVNTTSAIIDDALRLMPAPVAVVGAARQGELAGLTAAWLTRVSMDPPLLLVAIGHERFTYEFLREGTAFTVSLLHRNQVEIARLFGLNSGRERDKWSEVDHELLADGSPVLTHCSARFQCRLVQRVTAGDHDLFIGEVAEAWIIDGGPALPMRGSDYAPRS